MLKPFFSGRIGNICKFFAFTNIWSTITDDYKKEVKRMSVPKMRISRGHSNTMKDRIMSAFQGS